MSETKAHMTTPCENCPYRTDAPLQYWDRAEYASVLRGEQSELGTTFGCHKQIDRAPGQRGLCAGFLLDQKNRGVPSIMLRIVLMRDKSARDAFDRVSSPVEMYPSAKAMCRANGVRSLRASDVLETSAGDAQTEETTRAAREAGRAQNLPRDRALT